MKNAGLPRYARWQLWDYLKEKGAATLIVVALFASIAVMSARAKSPTGTLDGVDSLVLRGQLASLLNTFALLGSLFAVNGIVANDRKLGYHRFLFAKPVSIPAYYAQAFLVHGAGLVALSYLVTALWSLLVRPAYFPLLPIGVLATYAAVGGVGFLFSTFWRFDWLSTVAVFGVGRALRELYLHEGGWRETLVQLLPPTEKIDELLSAVTSDGLVPGDTLAHVAGYGLLCFVLGLLHLRARSFTVT